MNGKSIIYHRVHPYKQIAAKMKSLHGLGKITATESTRLIRVNRYFVDLLKDVRLIERT